MVPMSILRLLPQYFFLGGLDGMAYESIERFFKDQEIPPSLKPYMIDSAIGVFGVGKIGNVLLSYVVDKITERENNLGWFAGTINSSRLDNYYWFLATLTAINFLWYIFVAIRYPPKNRENRSSWLSCCTGKKLLTPCLF
ncbi:hypothetical protein L484_009850 [Morus notabilis]|uniref:Peptide/nitrate transporter n=1 Tax=Morus notabilis TaxID=981085 RepID=W9QWM7_9ROSA|nr:hypothetical protein L484_009850 [Morus notabilis]